MILGAPIPILRIFDESMAKRFYVDFLGFAIDWEHRFEDGLPLYAQVSHGACVLHLSGHHGDATPGSAVRMEVPGLQRYLTELQFRGHPGARPGIERQPWAMDEMRITDPFGNHLIFFEHVNQG
jgi:uncharacterized glyoxalase superfamily protein PhnB